MTDEEIYKQLLYERMPHPGFIVIEKELFGDYIFVDDKGEIGKPKTIYVGSFSKFCFGMWGLRNDIVDAVCKHSLEKVHRKIERLVDLIKLKSDYSGETP